MTAENATTPARVKAQPWRWNEVQLLATIILINVVDGLDNQLLPLSIGTLSHEWSVHPGVFSGAVSAGFLGAALGTPLGGWLGDRWGRKQALLTGVFTLGLMTLAMVLCDTPGELAIARLLAGVGLGTCLPPMLALVIETVTPDKRGTAVALTMFSLPLGLTLSGIAIPRLNKTLGWEMSVIVCSGAVLAIAFIALFSLHETVSKPASHPRTHRSQSFWRGLVNSLHGLEVAPTLGLIGGMFMVYIAMAVAMSWLPAVSLGHGFSQIAAGQAISLWAFFGMAGTLATGWVVNRLGGRTAAKIVVGGFGGAALLASVMLVAIPSDARALYCAAAFAGFFASAAITVLYAASAEQFPQEMRAKGMAIATLAGKAGGIVGGGSGIIALALPSLSAFFAALGLIVLAGWLSLLGGWRRLPGKQVDKGNARLPT